MDMIELALQRAGYPSLRAFQQANDLVPSGTADAQTLQALMPYFVGYMIHRIQQGDTYYQLARRYGTSVQAILTANPGLDPNRLPIGQLLTIPLGFPVVPTEVPFTSQVLHYCIRGLTARYPALQEVVIARTAQGRPVPVLRIGSGKRVVFYNAAHHANEWITVPLVMQFLEQYAAAAASNGRLGDVEVAPLLRSTTLYIAPMVNPDGVDLVTGAIGPGDPGYEKAQKLAENYPDIPFPDGWKANLQGVDLNLNYPAGWEEAQRIKAEQGYTSPGPRDFVGSAPLDQPESAAMAAFTALIQPALILAYHTQGKTIYWKYLDYDPPGAQELGERMSQASGYLLEQTPYASGFAGYKDWFIQQYNLPGYTIEAGEGENPLPLTQFDEIYQENLSILLLGLTG